MLFLLRMSCEVGLIQTSCHDSWHHWSSTRCFSTILLDWYTLEPYNHRRSSSKTFIFGFHVNFQGVYIFIYRNSLRPKWNPWKSDIHRIFRGKPWYFQGCNILDISTQMHSTYSWLTSPLLYWGSCRMRCYQDQQRTAWQPCWLVNIVLIHPRKINSLPLKNDGWKRTFLG